MRVPNLPAEGEPITEVWGRQIVQVLKSLIPQSTSGCIVCRTPSGTTYKPVIPGQRKIVIPEIVEFDFALTSNEDGTFAPNGAYNNNGTWTRMSGWILTPRGPRSIASNSHALDDSDFVGGTSANPRIFYLKASPPEFNDGACYTDTTDAFLAFGADKLRVPLAEIGIEGTGADARPVIFRYCRPILAVSYNAPEDAP